MSALSSQQPLWKTKRRNRPPLEPVESSAASADSSAPSQEGKGDYSFIDSSSLPIDPNKERQETIKSLLAGLPPALDLAGPQEPPQENGFIGLFLRVLIWQIEYRTQRKDIWERVSPYAGRVGPQKKVNTIKIGEGASFTVYKRYDNGRQLGREPQLVVMKSSKVRFGQDGKPNDNETFRSLMAEINTLSKDSLRKHPNIVKLLDIRWDHPSLEREQLGPTLYLEYASLGTLPEFCSSQHPGTNNQKIERQILLDVCLGLQALHQSSIIHGDIKPSNILVFQEKERVVAKLSDFGSAILLNLHASDKVNLPGISPPWDAPEAGAEIAPGLLTKTDIYSLGLLCWWFYLGIQDPFGLESDDSNVFGFLGDKAEKMEALKALKRREDLGPWMERSIVKFDSSVTDDINFMTEVFMIGKATLKKDPELRSLDDVIRTLRE